MLLSLEEFGAAMQTTTALSCRRPGGEQRTVSETW
jgi:hypothetical protein